MGGKLEAEQKASAMRPMHHVQCSAAKPFKKVAPPKCLQFEKIEVFWDALTEQTSPLTLTPNPKPNFTVCAGALNFTIHTVQCKRSAV